MNIYAISDLHLSTDTDKPMDIFGDGWQNHFEKIAADWQNKVTDDDLVLLGGDMSWGMTIEQASADFSLVGALKGKKIVIRGNHDYWWSSYGKVKNAFRDFIFLQNNAVKFGNFVICGTRGWNFPSAISEPSDQKIFDRELIRLEMSLTDAKNKAADGDKIIALLHYPPFEADFADTLVTSLLERYSVSDVCYGHLHGKNARVKPLLEKNGINYHLTSCDLIANQLIKLY